MSVMSVYNQFSLSRLPPSSLPTKKKYIDNIQQIERPEKFIVFVQKSNQASHRSQHHSNACANKKKKKKGQNNSMYHFHQPTTTLYLCILPPISPFSTKNVQSVHPSMSSETDRMHRMFVVLLCSLQLQGKTLRKNRTLFSTRSSVTLSLYCFRCVFTSSRKKNHPSCSPRRSPSRACAPGCW